MMHLQMIMLSCLSFAHSLRMSAPRSGAFACMRRCDNSPGNVVCDEKGTAYKSQCMVDMLNCFRKMSNLPQIKKGPCKGCIQECDMMKRGRTKVCDQNGKTYQSKCNFLNAQCVSGKPLVETPCPKRGGNRFIGKPKPKPAIGLIGIPGKGKGIPIGPNFNKGSNEECSEPLPGGGSVNYTEGSKWTSKRNPCKTCTCVEEKAVCAMMACVPPKCANPRKKKGTCCEYTCLAPKPPITTCIKDCRKAVQSPICDEDNKSYLSKCAFEMVNCFRDRKGLKPLTPKTCPACLKICPKVRRPDRICDQDGKRYKSKCEFENANCRKEGTLLATECKRVWNWFNQKGRGGKGNGKGQGDKNADEDGKGSDGNASGGGGKDPQGGNGGKGPQSGGNGKNPQGGRPGKGPQSDGAVNIPQGGSAGKGTPGGGPGKGTPGGGPGKGSQGGGAGTGPQGGGPGNGSQGGGAGNGPQDGGAGNGPQGGGSENGPQGGGPGNGPQGGGAGKGSQGGGPGKGQKGGGPGKGQKGGGPGKGRGGRKGPPGGKNGDDHNE